MAFDKVRPLKLENPGSGGTEDDMYPTATDPSEDYIVAKGFVFEDNDGRNLELDASGNLILTDVGGTTQLNQLVNDSSHRVIDQLVHEVSENSYTTNTRNGFLITQSIIWTDTNMTTKIRQFDMTYNGFLVNTITTQQFNTSGTVVETQVDTYSYTGSLVDNITTTLTAV